MVLYPRPRRNIDPEAPGHLGIDMITAPSLDGIVVGGPRALAADYGHCPQVLTKMGVYRSKHLP